MTPDGGTVIAATSAEERIDLRKARADRLAGLRHFRFHQLITLIEMQRQGSRPVGALGDPAEEYIRFRATRSLSFGPSDLSAVDYSDDGERLDIRVNFFGLYGPASPLPPSFTERIIEEDRAQASVEDLLDLFNHRLISLLHVIWRKYRYYLRYETGGSDALSKRFLALCGFPIEDRDRIGQISRSALLPHVGLLSLYSSSADVVSATLSNFFKIPCRIEEFIDRHVVMDRDAQFQLGVANNQLGEDTIIGSEIDDDLGKFRVCLGRSPFSAIAPFLPGGSRHRQLSELLSMVNREPLDWDMQFEFEPETVPMGCLGEMKLGWSGWLYAHDADHLESTVRLAVLEADRDADQEDEDFSDDLVHHPMPGVNGSLRFKGARAGQ
ncbi:type VI secretion system protein ImpH [Rhizobium sp. BK313]|uniref:type VI secretion system baseplate subunit TssG n=1 Tax=Rhizobium sp. BK313 TaxID=2587081 RepID=UPI00105B2550|nr:type VI secretion system baseplate subunit TssG [Rhizobium sp. BK313]MBB3457479.1 type VI secretion system protein ImpH [Rhizobium sp. BK313]